MHDVNVNVTMKPQKTMLPLILGPCGFILNIPNILCATICAAGAQGFNKIGQMQQSLNAHQMTSDAPVFMDSAMNSLNATSSTMQANLLIMVVLWLVLFVMSFFGMSRVSKWVGMLMLPLSAAMVVMCCMNFSFVGACGAILYALAGVFGIVNSKR